ncbi:DUF7931 domain-containing protein [Aromatoleum sp.]|uniref:DUF7931 domain-containing protein n=1 Tax=Aromatoleum sp. TaxID=2307007 RepID=UPI003FA5440D
MKEFSPRRFDSYASYRSAMLAALDVATSTIAIFDPDLRDAGLENSAAIVALDRLCRTSPRREAVRILVHAADFAERECPRLVALIGAFTHRAALRVTSTPFLSWTQPFLVADERHVVTRFDRDGPRGKLAVEDERTSSMLLAQFETMWMSGTPTTTGAPLGI